MFRRHGFSAQQPACVVALLLAAGAMVAADSDAMLYRVFLRDGSALVSYGEFARVADRVVMSIPVGEGAPPPLQLVSIAESAVDWERTERYGEAARARRYADTRGETDFALLSSEVARALNEVALTSDPTKRLALAAEARRVLAAWPSQHYGYRASDVAQLSAWLDEVVSELRVAAGQSRFDLSFTANTALPPSPEPLLPPPGQRERIELAFAAARMTEEPAERLSLLRAIEAALAPAATASVNDNGRGPRADAVAEAEARWAANLRSRAAGEIETELRIGKAYADLTTRILASADERTRRADVRGVERLIRSVLAEDEKLGRHRPQETAALLASLDGRLDAARRLRLARDAWTLRLRALRDYRRRAAFAVEQLQESKPALTEIRHLAGPSTRALSRLTERVAAGRRHLAAMKVPPELETPHTLMTSALHMAGRASDARRTAITSGDMKTAWDASSAAAGALMLFEQAIQELDRLTALPELR